MNAMGNDPVAARRARAGALVRSFYGLAVFALAATLVWLAVKPLIYTAAPGVVTATKYVISTPYASRIIEVHVQPGVRVGEGEKLVDIRAPEVTALFASIARARAEQSRASADLRIRLSVAEASLPSARKRVEIATENIERLGPGRCTVTATFCSDLYRESALAVGAMSQIEAEAREVRAELGKLSELENSILKLEETVQASYRGGAQLSPVAGLIGPKVVSRGQSVAAGEAIVTVFDEKQMHVEWVMSSSRIRPPRFNDPVFVISGSIARRGRVSEVLPIADATRARASLFSEPDQGQLVRIALDDGEDYPPLLSSVEVRFNYWRWMDGLVELYVRLMEGAGLWRRE